MGQTDRAGGPDLRRRGWYSRDSAAPFSYLHGTLPLYEIQNHDRRDGGGRSSQTSSRQKQARTNQDETISQEGANVTREMCLLHNEMTALKKG